VLALNLKRRQLTPTQRATVGTASLPLLEEEARQRMLAGKAAHDPVTKVSQGRSVDKAAKLVGVNRQYISDGPAYLTDPSQIFDKGQRRTQAKENPPQPRAMAG
jgi:hypothetical protein